MEGMEDGGSSLARMDGTFGNGPRGSKTYRSKNILIQATDYPDEEFEESTP
jgi:hypothetical protein